mmetsp:Transcript_76869/g.152454  ORF Transcript_76869/g.152454 Transcript_76869/m.152454 type:complete len:216 (-) Transcript_76869:527-1174(-)
MASSPWSTRSRSTRSLGASRRHSRTTSCQRRTGTTPPSSVPRRCSSPRCRRRWPRAGRGCRHGMPPSRSTTTKRSASRSGCRRCRRSTSSARSHACRARISSATTAWAPSSSAGSLCRSARLPLSMRKRRAVTRSRTSRSTSTSCSSASRAAASTSTAPSSKSRWARRWERWLPTSSAISTRSKSSPRPRTSPRRGSRRQPHLQRASRPRRTASG